MTEGGVDVPEVVLQRGHLLCVLLRGEDLRGKLSQLGGKYEEVTQEVTQIIFSGVSVIWKGLGDLLETMKCRWGLHTESTRPLGNKEGW